MNKLKRFSALTLACLTAISSPLTSYADTGLGGNASGSDHGGVTTVSGGDFGVNVSPDRLGRIGIRLSLVDANDPSKVISYLPDGQTPMVVDILYVDRATFEHYTSPPDNYLTQLTGDNTYSAVKTQSYTEQNFIARVCYDELLASLGDELGGDMQPWANYHDNAYYSLGNEFTTWCVSDKDGNLKTLNGEIVTKTINAQGQEVQILPAENGGSQVIVDGDLAFSSIAQAKESYSEINSYYSSRGTAIFSSPAADKDTMYTAEVRRLALQRSKGNISDDEYETLRKKLDELKVQASASASVDSNKKSFLAKLKDKFFPSEITSYAAEGENVAAGGTISNSRIETLLTLKSQNGTPLLQTKSMIESGNTKLTEATEDWVLLVEPIVYLTIFRSGDDRHYIIPKQYGTISNIAEALKAKVGGSVTSKAKYGWFNWKALNGPLWGALHVSDSTDKETGQTINGFKFKNGDVLATPTAVGSYVSFDTMVDWNTWKNVGDHKEKVGYGVNVYYKGDMISTSSISTWDEVNYPDGLPGPPEDPSDETRFPKETDYGDNSKKFNIVKWYYYENADGTQEVVDTQSRQQTPHKIVVENEGNADSDFYWMVEKWGTSLNGDDIPEDGSTDTTFEEYYKKYKGTYSGKEPNIVTVKPEDPDKSIYVKLVMKIIPKKDLDIVRVYENTDGTTTVENELDVPYTPTVDGNSPKGGYDFEESVTTHDPIKEITTWTEVPTGTNGTTPQIPVKETDKTVYIRFTQTDDPEPNPSKLLLHENEISHQFNLSDANGGSFVEGIREYSSVSVSGNCPYTWSCSNPDHGTHSCSAPYVYQNSDDWSFTITNDADYASNKTFTWAWVQTDQKDYSGNGLSESGGTGTSTPNGEIILQRTINDTVTLYPGKNGGNESKLQEMGLRAPSYTPAKARKDGATDQPTRKTWYETFTTNWQFHNANTPTAYFSPSCGHGGTDTDSHTNTGNEATLNETYSKANNTEVYGLWGRANAGLSEPNETSNLSSAKWVFNNLNFIPRKEHLKTSEIQFYPYYKMKFVSEINGAEQDAYLTSENLSKLLNVQRVDTSISANGNTSTGNSLYLDSTQSL